MLSASKPVRKWCRMLISILILTLEFTILASAAEPINLEKDVTLTLVYKDGSEPIVGAKFEIYQVGDVSEEGEFTLTGDFAKYPVSVANLDTTGWRNLAATLVGYAQRDGVSPIDTTQTDEIGVLKFPSHLDQLKPGLYLVVGQKHTQDGKIYTAEPFMAWLPDRNEVFDEWCYDVTAIPKHESKSED